MVTSRYTVSKTFFYSVILLPIFFIYGYILISLYTEGDQIAYRSLYTHLADTKFNNVMPLALERVSSVEPISIYVLWSGAVLGIEKDIFISLLNAILLLGLFLFCRRHHAGPIATFLLLTNFYIIVLMTGAERLKIAYIIIFWATLYTPNKGKFLTGFSGFAHLQNFILIPSLALAYYSHSIRRFLKAGKFKIGSIFIIIIMIIFAAIIFIIFNEMLIRKATVYISNAGSSIQIINLVILTIVAIFATRYRWRMFLLLLPMYPAVLLLGGQRVNMIAVTLALYFLTTERALNHPFVLFLLMYFSLKSIPFINNIILYGNGFV